MSKNTLEFKRRAAKAIQDSLNTGELNIKVLDVTCRRKHFWEKYSGVATLEFSIADVDTGELLVEIERVPIMEGSSVILKDINNAFTITFH